MRAALVALMLAALIGCGKKADPDLRDVPTSKAVSCSDVQILRVDKAEDGSSSSLLERMDHAEGAQPGRMVRSGDWGVVGDKFSYCE